MKWPGPELFCAFTLRVCEGVWLVPAVETPENRHTCDFSGGVRQVQKTGMPGRQNAESARSKSGDG